MECTPGITGRRGIGAAVSLAAVLWASSASATTVLVMSLERDRAQLLVNGTAGAGLACRPELAGGRAAGERRPDKAVIEIEGRVLSLGLGQSTSRAPS